MGISSLGSFVTRPTGGLKFYYASKRCLNTILDAYKPHLEKHGVMISNMHPGLVDTAMVSQEYVHEAKDSLYSPEKAAREILVGIEQGKGRKFPTAHYRRIQYKNVKKSAKRLARMLIRGQ